MKIYYVNTNQKKAVVILITDKIDFKQRKLSGIRDILDDDKAVNFSRRHKNL